MNKLTLYVSVDGEVSEEQLARMFFELHTEVNKFLQALPVKQSEMPVILA